MKTAGKIAAAGGAALMFAGMAAPAIAAPGDRAVRDSRPGECSVQLDTVRGRGQLNISVDASRRADTAVARIDFDNRRDALRRVPLNNRGDGDLRVVIPRRADRVRVTVFVQEGRRGFTTCTDTLNLRRVAATPFRVV